GRGHLSHPDARQHRRHRRRPHRKERLMKRTPLLLLAAALLAGGCGTAQPAAAPAGAVQTQAAPIKEPLVLTYDGGLYVLDGDTLKVAEDIPLPGFNRRSEEHTSELQS